MFIILLLLISILGFIASAVAHGITFLGIDPQRLFPPVIALHFILFVVWVPMIFMLKKDPEIPAMGKDYWKNAMRNAPFWMRAFDAILVGYAIFNFVFTIWVLNEGGSPSIQQGRKVLSNHGKVIRNLTDAEYELHSAYETRAMSGHWLAFYSAGMTVFYSQMKGRRDRKRAAQPEE